MKNGAHWLGAVVLFGLLLLLLAGGVMGREGEEAVAGDAGRAFPIRLSPELFPRTERPAVEFDHDLHTAAMESGGEGAGGVLGKEREPTVLLVA